MAEDTRSTSNSIDATSDTPVSSGLFDLRSWQGLTTLLQIGRTSNLSPTEYAIFRDLVLKYASERGSNSELKKKIDAIVASFTSTTRQESTIGQSTAQEDEAVRAVQTSPMGSRRQYTSFAPAHINARTAPVQVKQKVTGTVAQTPKVDVILPKEVQPPKIEMPILEAVAQEPTAVPENEIPTQPHSTPRSIDEYKARIAEIKRTVNARVGNPVTLMDAQNQVGKQYMSALLLAMKATGPGSTINIGDAMVGLENAYIAIEQFITNREAGIIESPEISDSEVDHVAQVTSHDNLEESSTIASTMAEEQVDSEYTSKSTTTDGLEPEVPPQPSSQQVSPIHIPSLIDLERNDLQLDSDAIVAQQSSQTPIFKGMNQSYDTTKHTVYTAPLPSVNMASSIRIETPEPHIMIQAELMTTENTAALNQLLHEWSIFESSGLFGIGPGGFEHPLYKKLAKLTMAEVIGGRWEDATFEITHTIKDYVDAWRHEQGLAYNPSETFEHYLRRVIQRILKRQGRETVV